MTSLPVTFSEIMKKKIEKHWWREDLNFKKKSTRNEVNIKPFFIKMILNSWLLALIPKPQKQITWCFYFLFSIFLLTTIRHVPYGDNTRGILLRFLLLQSILVHLQELDRLITKPKCLIEFHYRKHHFVHKIFKGQLY